MQTHRFAFARVAPHVVLGCVVAVLAALLGAPVLAQTGGWQPGPEAVGDSTFVGFVDTPANGTTLSVGDPIQVGGWFVDTTAEGWAGFDNLRVFDGLADAGTLLATGNVGAGRPDVARALGNPYWTPSGFVALVVPFSLGRGDHVLSVYAHSPAKGWWYKQVALSLVPPPPASATSVPVPGGAPTASNLPVAAILSPRADEKVFTHTTTFTIEGFALDPSATPYQGVGGSGVDSVHVVVTDADNGILQGDAVQGKPQPSATAYGSQFDNTGFQFVIHPTEVHAGIAHIEVVAHSAVTGKLFGAAATFQVAEGSP